MRTATGETLHADVVIDATGRRSRGPEWLVQVGARPVHEEQADCGFAYYTRYFGGTEPQRIGPVFMMLGNDLDPHASRATTARGRSRS